MWYRFEKGKSIVIHRIKKYQVAWYDMEHEGNCFDEDFYQPYDLDMAIPFVETVEDEGKSDRSRVFAHFDNGDVYELRLIKIPPSCRCTNFYD